MSNSSLSLDDPAVIPPPPAAGRQASDTVDAVESLSMSRAQCTSVSEVELPVHFAVIIEKEENEIEEGDECLRKDQPPEAGVAPGALAGGDRPESRVPPSSRSDLSLSSIPAAVFQSVVCSFFERPDFFAVVLSSRSLYSLFHYSQFHHWRSKVSAPEDKHLLPSTFFCVRYEALSRFYIFYDFLYRKQFYYFSYFFFFGPVLSFVLLFAFFLFTLLVALSFDGKLSSFSPYDAFLILLAQIAVVAIGAVLVIAMALCREWPILKNVERMERRRQRERELMRWRMSGQAEEPPREQNGDELANSPMQTAAHENSALTSNVSPRLPRSNSVLSQSVSSPALMTSVPSLSRRLSPRFALPVPALSSSALSSSTLELSLQRGNSSDPDVALDDEHADGSCLSRCRERLSYLFYQFHPTNAHSPSTAHRSLVNAFFPPALASRRFDLNHCLHHPPYIIPASRYALLPFHLLYRLMLFDSTPAFSSPFASSSSPSFFIPKSSSWKWLPIVLLTGFSLALYALFLRSFAIAKDFSSMFAFLPDSMTAPPEELHTGSVDVLKLPVLLSYLLLCVLLFSYVFLFLPKVGVFLKVDLLLLRSFSFLILAILLNNLPSFTSSAFLLLPNLPASTAASPIIDLNAHVDVLSAHPEFSFLLGSSVSSAASPFAALFYLIEAPGGVVVNQWWALQSYTLKGFNAQMVLSKLGDSLLSFLAVIEWIILFFVIFSYRKTCKKLVKAVTNTAPTVSREERRSILTTAAKWLDFSVGHATFAVATLVFYSLLAVRLQLDSAPPFQPTQDFPYPCTITMRPASAGMNSSGSASLPWTVLPSSSVPLNTGAEMVLPCVPTMSYGVQNAFMSQPFSQQQYGQLASQSFQSSSQWSLQTSKIVLFVPLSTMCGNELFRMSSVTDLLNAISSSFSSSPLQSFSVWNSTALSDFLLNSSFAKSSSAFIHAQLMALASLCDLPTQRDMIQWTAPTASVAWIGDAHTVGQQVEINDVIEQGSQLSWLSYAPLIRQQKSTINSTYPPTPPSAPLSSYASLYSWHLSTLAFSSVYLPFASMVASLPVDALAVYVESNASVSFVDVTQWSWTVSQWHNALRQVASGVVKESDEVEPIAVGSDGWLVSIDNRLVFSEFPSVLYTTLLSPFLVWFAFSACYAFLSGIYEIWTAKWLISKVRSPTPTPL